MPAEPLGFASCRMLAAASEAGQCPEETGTHRGTRPSRTRGHLIPVRSGAFAKDERANAAIGPHRRPGFARIIFGGRNLALFIELSGR